MNSNTMEWDLWLSIVHELSLLIIENETHLWISEKQAIFFFTIFVQKEDEMPAPTRIVYAKVLDLFIVLMISSFMVSHSSSSSEFVIFQWIGDQV